ncbi:MAG TPA: radical SAM protein, partial [Roseiflexaceae bacterium]|nr:radical SAM protein [Roseiflexaceae bacterium]
MRVVLISTYELGRQPFGLASPAAWLRRAGADVACLDLAVDSLDPDLVRAAGMIALYLPMHTATRMALDLIPQLRAIAPGALLVAYGLYAPLNEAWLRELGVAVVLGGECEPDLFALYERVRDGGPQQATQPERRISTERIAFVAPERDGLPPLSRYAMLAMPDGTSRLAGYTEATRGCKHTCRHCPVVPIYQGRFRAVPRHVVLEDIRRQVAAGAQHITFGDPDFLNGPGHAIPLVEALHAEHPELTYDVTIKVEHLLRHAEVLPVLRDTGCVFVTSAVESSSDRVLAILEKN